MPVIVLGAGAVGVATAWYLRKAGHEVTVVERQDGAALETSWGNGGVIHASEVEPWSQPGMPLKILKWLGQENAPLLLRYGAIPHMWRWGLAFARNCTPEKFAANSRANLELALYSLRSLQEIGGETGIQYDRATKGVLKIYRSKESLDGAARACDMLARHGLRYERIDVARCVDIEPALSSTSNTLAGALYFERDEVGDCNKFTQGLAAACAERGVRFHYKTTVQSIEAPQGKVTGVMTGAGRIPADSVVVALGSFTAPLLARLGIHVPIYPVKGVSITFPRGAWNSAPISGSAEITGYDATPAMPRAEAIIANASFTFPELSRHLDRSQARIWAGLRPVSPAGTPIMGPAAIGGLYVNAGHGHLGWTLACGSGRVVADMVSGRTPKIGLPGRQGVPLPHAA
jgi:D-amino-acid dehydrogenase